MGSDMKAIKQIIRMVKAVFPGAMLVLAFGACGDVSAEDGEIIEQIEEFDTVGENVEVMQPAQRDSISRRDVHEFLEALEQHSFYMPDPGSDQPVDGETEGDSDDSDNSGNKGSYTANSVEMPDPGSDKPSGGGNNPPLPPIGPTPPDKSDGDK